MNRSDPTTAEIVRELSTPMANDPDSLSRRRFLHAVALTGAVSLVPAWLADQAAAATPLGPSEGVLVLLMMYGGNDGLNTVVPYNDGHYHTMRPHLALGGDRVLPLNDHRGLHPRLGFVKQMWDQGHVAILDGVGHPQPDLSHFTSMNRWMTATTKSTTGFTGWLGRYVDGLGGTNPFQSITIGSSVPLVLAGNRRTAIALPHSVGSLLSLDPDPVYQRQYATITRFAGASSGLGPLADSLASSGSEAIALAANVSRYYNAKLPGGELAAKMTLCARLINANVGARVLVVGYGDFDTHAGQNYHHDQRMLELNEALQAFYGELSPSFAGRTLVLTSSEFGRRAWANHSGGTDHGTSSTLLALGAGVVGGFHGSLPSLANHQVWENIATTVDYRHVYGNVLDRWLGGSASEIIGTNAADLGFLRTPSGSGSTSTSVTGVPGGSRIQLSRLYLAYFSRLPDDEGLEFWLAQRRRGLSLDAVSADFARSAEFVQTYGSLDSAGFVDLIYRNVLRRAPDAAGRDYWIGLLNAGVDRGGIMTGFSESSEYVSLTRPELIEHEKTGPIGRLYRAYLQREGEPAGLAYWLGTYHSLAEISAHFATSTEFTQRYGALSNEQFVEQIYANVMNRPSDPAGLAFWTTQLNHGRSRGEIMLEFSNSPEFIRLVGTG